MQALTVTALLDAWERGLGQALPVRALLLLSLAEPEMSPAELGALSIGHRDDRLLNLRSELFGAGLVAVVDCPACGGRVEFTAPVDGLRVDPGAGGGRELDAGEYRLRLRPPTSGDLLAVSGAPDVETAREQLLARCIQVEREGVPEGLEKLPSPVLETAVTTLAEIDPAADTRFDIACPTCAHAWEPPFDIAAYLWAEVEHWALQTLRDVHDLARVYGWREADVLALSPLRRRLYLEMAYG